MPTYKKVAILGLDSIPSNLFFRKLLPQLPTIRQLCERSIFGTLKSCDPPITIPAWQVMATGKSPHQLNVYGFRERKGFSYTEISLANSTMFKEKRLWDILAEDGRTSCLFAVPPSFPPYPVKGNLVSCHITPDGKSSYTYPKQLQPELEELFGSYIPDVVFRSHEREKVREGLYSMSEQHFGIMEHLIKNKPWDFFMGVEIGPDRLHHVFWKFFDPKHHLYVKGNKYESAIPEYYRFIDEKIKNLISLFDDDTLIFIVSDHGTKGMQGAFCINEWLIEKGYLALKTEPKKIMKLEEADVDWTRTTAWGWGGYYARIFLNVRGREEKGMVDRSDYEKIRRKLIQDLKRIKTPKGKIMGVRVFAPRGGPEAKTPDLMVYLRNLNWRSAGTVGHNTLYLKENDTGPDDSVHSKEGIFLIYNKKNKFYGQGNLRLGIQDIAPTILKALGATNRPGLKGKTLEV
jgi:predicted AlkP superfamily phosphohydrolase/phosphomutase